MTDLSIIAYFEARYPKIDPLTERQREVLYLFSTGMTVEEIALDLCISRVMIRRIRDQIRARLGADGFRKAVFRNG